MKSLIQYIVILFCAQGVFAADTFNKGLVLIIHQEHLSGASAQEAAMLPMLIKQIHTNAFNYLGEAIEKFQGEDTGSNTPQKIIDAWDDSRYLWLIEKAYDKYDNMYYVKGKQAEDAEYMRKQYEKAFLENDVVDIIAIVHTDRHLIGLPQDLSKIRMAYISACHNKDIKNFIVHRKATASVGHKGEYSASPFFSHAFIHHWLSGSNVMDALMLASINAADALNAPQAQMLLFLLKSHHKTPAEALKGSALSYALYPGVDGAMLNINSKNPLKGDVKEAQVEEGVMQ